jgi:hypothetical protein
VFLDMPELGGKWLEFLIALLGRVPRVAVLGDPAIHASQFRSMDVAARRVGVPLHPLEVRAADGYALAFEAAATGGAEALILLSAPLVSRPEGGWQTSPCSTGCRRCPCFRPLPRLGGYWPMG